LDQQLGGSLSCGLIGSNGIRMCSGNVGLKLSIALDCELIGCADR
jgi:hypothetical protein